jgi:hypothetical protein
MGTSICFKFPYDHYNIGILGDAKPIFKLCRKQTNKQTNKQTYNKEITTLHKELGRKLHINAK